MKELTDLEICKRIAEIDKVTDNMFKYWRLIRDERGNEVEYEHYNPLTDDALCFQLMVKYDINLTSMEPTLIDGSDGYEYICYKQGVYQNVSAILSIDKLPNKAILLAIIEAHNESN